MQKKIAVSGYHAIESILIQRPELIINLFIARINDKRGVKIRELAKTSRVNFELIDPKK